MAVNKNFVVKNGLEVDTNTLFVDSANNRVAIGTTVPTATLDVRGKVLSDSQVESFVGKFVGIVTAGAVGVTTMTTTDAVVSGFSTLGKANATSLNVTTGFSTVQSLTATDLTVSIGATITKDLNVGAALTVGAGLTVIDNSRFENDLEVGGNLNVGGATTLASNGGITTTGGDFFVGSSVSVGGALTVTGNTTFVNDVSVNGNLSLGGGNGNLAFGDLNVNNALISGIATVGFTSTSDAFVSGMTTTDLLNVGFGGTMINVVGVPSTMIGINQVNPAYTLDIDGDINTTGSVRINGNAIVSSAGATEEDVTALAIALG